MWPQFAAFKLKCNLNIRSTATSGLYYQKLQSGANVLNSHFKTPFFLDQSAPSAQMELSPMPVPTAWQICPKQSCVHSPGTGSLLTPSSLACANATAVRVPKAGAHCIPASSRSCV